MQKTTEWRRYAFVCYAATKPHLLIIFYYAHHPYTLARPAPLSLSILVLDNLNVAVDSAEKAAQDKRLAHVLEIR